MHPHPDPHRPPAPEAASDTAPDTAPDAAPDAGADTLPRGVATAPLVHWQEGGADQRAHWLSPAGAPAPRRLAVADDTLKADTALRWISEGTALVWRGDFQNARHLLQALGRRIDEKAARAAARAPQGAGPADAQARRRGSRGPAAAAAVADAVASAAVRPGEDLPGHADAEARASASADTLATATAGAGADAPAGDPRALAFHRHRQAQAHRARILGGVLVPLAPGWQVPLRRAPDVQAACEEVMGPWPTPAARLAQPARSGQPAQLPHTAHPSHPSPSPDEPPPLALISLRELQGLVGAHEWRKKGVPIPALGASVHPHHGVFSPVRGEYIDLVARAPLPAALAAHPLAVDVGTGTGVLAAVLARRGVPRIIATDQDPRALACAADNLQRLGLAAAVELQRADLFPAPVSRGCGLVVCNPPWVPARPASPIEAAVYDPDSRMLRGFLGGVAAHLAPDGEAWLILSDLAEHLGLRRREDLLGWIEAGGLQVRGRLEARPRHPKATDRSDPLHAARMAERTSLWRLGRR
ncbi:MAG: methyltransferase [Pseudomonadota bacterium]